MSTYSQTFSSFILIIIRIFFNICQYLCFNNFSWTPRNRFLLCGLLPQLDCTCRKLKCCAVFRTDILSLVIISMTLSLKSFEYPIVCIVVNILELGYISQHFIYCDLFATKKCSKLLHFLIPILI